MSPFNKITPAYVPVLTKMHQMCFEKPWHEADFTSLLQLPTTQGLINDKAFILCSVCQDEAEILTLGVLPEARRQGIGLKLIDQMQTHLKNLGVGALLLEVNAFNAPAKRLYEKAGFVQIACRKGYYQTKDGAQDALILKKELT